MHTITHTKILTNAIKGGDYRTFIVANSKANHSCRQPRMNEKKNKLDAGVPELEYVPQYITFKFLTQ